MLWAILFYLYSKFEKIEKNELSFFQNYFKKCITFPNKIISVKCGIDFESFMKDKLYESLR